MTNFASRISGVAMLALAALPIAALPASALAATTVKVADINLLTPEGVATYQQRADAAGRKFCSPERTVSGRHSCRAGVKVELSEKLGALRTAQLEHASQTFATR
jgi:UrcA family protein